MGTVAQDAEDKGLGEGEAKRGENGVEGGVVGGGGEGGVDLVEG